MMDEKTREELNTKRWMAAAPKGESRHFYICKACGQAVDKRRLGDVLYQVEKGHKPLSVTD